MFRFRFIPREENFFDLFEKQARALCGCLPVVVEIISAVDIDMRWLAEVRKIEGECDGLTKALIEKASSTFITPIDPEDIYALAGAIDDVMDFMEEVVTKIVDYKFLPDEDLRGFLEILRISVELLSQAVFCLRGFKKIDDLRTQMKEREHQADALEREIIAESYDIDVARILAGSIQLSLGRAELQEIFDAYNYKRKRREIAEHLESAIDACDRVFNLLGNIYLKQS